VVNALQIKHILTGEKFPLPPSLVNHYPQLTELTLTNPSREDSEKILQKKLFTLDKDN
jgi:hypothetical protein